MRSALNADTSASPPFPFFPPIPPTAGAHRYFTKGLFRSRPAFSAISRFGIYSRLPDAARAGGFATPGINHFSRGGRRARVTRDLWRAREREYTARMVIMNIPFQRYRQDNLSLSLSLSLSLLRDSESSVETLATRRDTVAFTWNKLIGDKSLLCVRCYIRAFLCIHTCAHLWAEISKARLISLSPARLFSCARVRVNTVI